ncbi:MAG: methyltransferase, partial [Dokdonella sp.]
LDAAVSLRLLARRREGYALGALGASLVGNEAVMSMIEHHAILYADLHDPVAMLRARGGGELARYWAYARSDDPSTLSAPNVDRYSALMSASQPLVAEQVLDAYPLGAHRCLLDVGGGDGTFLANVGAQAPHLQLMLFDLPAVARCAQARFDASGLAERARVFGGSFLSDPLPQGADIVSLVRVLHDHDDASVLRILAAIRRVMPNHGVLLIAEPMAGTAGAEAMGDAYFGFYLMAMGSGKARTPAALGRLLERSGFDAGRLVTTALPIQTRLMVARPVSAIREK